MDDPSACEKRVENDTKVRRKTARHQKRKTFQQKHTKKTDNEIKKLRARVKNVLCRWEQSAPQRLPLGFVLARVDFGFVFV